MEPNVFDTQPGNSKLFITILKVLAAAGIALVLGLIIWKFVANLNFRMSGTSPKLTQVGDVLPFIDAQFNRDLGKGITVSSSPKIVTSTETRGKTLRINLGGPDKPLTVGNKYTITIHNVSNTKGERLADQTLNFTARDVLAEDMPKAQREFLMKRQANKPASPDNFVLDNISDLEDQGLEPEQELSFRAALFNFAPKAKITRITSSVQALDPVKAQEEGMQVYTFDMQIDDKKYKVRLECPELSAVQVFLTDSQGKQVFDSGIIDQQQSGD